ncbi:MAG: glycine cleavage system protein GcvH [Candidatus Zixiibacteriota bacterium]
MSEVRDDLKYTKDHEWVKVDGDTATIGITDYAQGELGDIVFFDISGEGDEYEAGDVMGSVEAVKAVSDIFSPVSGEVLEINPELEDNPEIANSEPYDGGWIAKIKLSNKPELDELLSADDYKAEIGD